MSFFLLKTAMEKGVDYLLKEYVQKPLQKKLVEGIVKVVLPLFDTVDTGHLPDIADEMAEASDAAETEINTQVQSEISEQGEGSQDDVDDDDIGSLHAGAQAAVDDDNQAEQADEAEDAEEDALDDEAEANSRPCKRQL